jgi:hypothetical protein
MVDDAQLGGSEGSLKGDVLQWVKNGSRPAIACLT